MRDTVASALRVRTPSRFMPRTALLHPGGARTDTHRATIAAFHIVAPRGADDEDMMRYPINQLGPRQNKRNQGTHIWRPFTGQQQESPPAFRFFLIKSNEINTHGETEIIKLDSPNPVTYLSFGRYLLDDFGFCDLARNRTNFPSDSNKSPSVAFTGWFNIIC
jgi:hypothetical protein